MTKLHALTQLSAGDFDAFLYDCDGTLADSMPDIPEVLVCAGETPHGKPYPDPFLAAAEKLGVPPHRFLVFEDGDPGIQAAEAAGMKWIRIDKI